MTVLHIIPVGDTFPRSRFKMQCHDATPDCWCHPTVSRNTAGRVYLHNAHDCREKDERQGRPQQGWMFVGGIGE